MLSPSEAIGSPYARQDAALSSSAFAPNSAVYRGTDLKPRAAIVTMEAASATDGMRYTMDGTTPVDASNVGDLWLGLSNEMLMLKGETAIKLFQAVLHGTTARIHITYFR